MRGRKIWAIGGFAAGAVLILFGVAALYLGATSYQLVRDELSQEKIVGGQDMSPEAIAAGVEEAGLEDVELPECDVVDEEIDTGAEARCFARVHAHPRARGDRRPDLRARWAASSPPTTPATRPGRTTRREAAKDEEGNPISNGAAEPLDQRDGARDRAERLVHG